MKILLITSSLNTGDGWGRYSRGLAGELSKDNEIRVITNISSDFPVIQNVFLYSPLSIANPLKILSAAKKIQRVYDDFSPDIVHFIAEPYVLTLPFLKIDKDTKTILTVHGTHCFMPDIFIRERLKFYITKLLVKASYKKVDKIISVSSYIKDYMLKRYKEEYGVPYDLKKVEVVTNWIDPKVFSSNTVSKKENKQKKSIIFVGQVKDRKGVLQSIEALNAYRKKYGNNFVLTIVGPNDVDPEYTKQLKSKINEFGLQDAVKWFGRANDEDLREIYGNADLYLMISIHSGARFEGFGLVYLEANAYGVPCIGSTISGAGDAIVEGKTGYLADPYKPEEVSEKISSILNEGAIKSEDCISWAKTNNISGKIEKIVELYKKS
jgi:phosphatidylinositol alpha-1,6-mannosyltransferase